MIGTSQRRNSGDDPPYAARFRDRKQQRDRIRHERVGLAIAFAADAEAMHDCLAALDARLHIGSDQRIARDHAQLRIARRDRRGIARKRRDFVTARKRRA
jgi:hypothetical protein